MNRGKRQYDLTEGGILQKLLQVALPIMGTQLMQMSYNLADMFWLGRVGSDAVAASGTAGMFMWLSAAFLLVGRMGAEIGVSQHLGRKDKEGAEHYAQNAVFLALVLGIAFGLVLVLGRVPLVGFFGIQDPAVAENARNYLAIIALAMPLNFVTSALVGTFNASGNSRTPFLINTVGLVANIVLDPILIFGFNMGVAGAAVATVACQAIGFVLMIVAIKRSGNRPFAKFTLFTRPEGAYIRNILRWSVPIALESMMFTLLSMVTSRFVAGFGTDAMAVSRVGSQIESLTWLIGGGYGSALTAFMGQNYGAGKWTRIHRGFTLSIGAMTVWGLLVTALIFFGGGMLFSIFLPDAQIIAMGAVYLRILAICQLPQCYEAVAGSSFKGTGRTIPPSVVSITCNVLRVVLCYVLMQTSLGLNGIWWGVAITASMRGLWGMAWYLIARRKLPREDMVPTAVRV